MCVRECVRVCVCARAQHKSPYLSVAIVREVGMLCAVDGDTVGVVRVRHSPDLHCVHPQALDYLHMVIGRHADRHAQASLYRNMCMLRA